MKLNKTRMGKTFMIAALSTVMLATGWQSPTKVEAAANAVPTYEVKFLLSNDAVLKQDFTLKNEVKEAFQINEPAARMLVEYFDTTDLSLNDSGWNVRFRKKEDKKKYELTYKKRYAVVNGDINAALTQANLDGFSSADTNYKAEVDWGYSKQTLSFSNDKEESASKGLNLPNEAEALNLLISKIPGKLDKTNASGWGTVKLLQAYAHGPILASRYSGTFEGLETDIEVWPIIGANGSGTEYVVEISFKTDDYQTAASKRTNLMNLLNNKGWLVPADSLKTNLVLERY
ncbi:CYTH domain-containing protein [Paenibacillus motobuensis]|uniref:CYTH domain-containing protein n=1 Tax=Paenibacillus TaxID=44249 RepID=UPI00203FABA2|nr:MULTISPECIES: CYTH domain-containing protein [Paenibacillus]MCM3039397.1 CYTH domain-containing protein [Paenibacillus lutimineralis]MCM3646501.1 CYTH domain-containing protein [Paenibacillus motobuensis]